MTPLESCREGLTFQKHLHGSVSSHSLKVESHIAIAATFTAMAFQAIVIWTLQFYPEKQTNVDENTAQFSTLGAVLPTIDTGVQ